MKQIETEIWVPNPEKPGYLMLERMKTIGEVYDELEQILKEQGIYGEMDYFGISSGWNGRKQEARKQDFPNYRWIACFAVEGGSEGHYIHVEIISAEGGKWKREIIFLGKTFCGLEHALKVSNICTQAFYR
jgi:hypothetical protein